MGSWAEMLRVSMSGLLFSEKADRQAAVQVCQLSAMGEMLTACAKLPLTPCQVLAPRRAILHTYDACRVLPLLAHTIFAVVRVTRTY
jgi:hypothetical protein